MTFEPEPGTRIHLKNDEVIEFVPLEASGPASVFAYAESGKEGTVYKVLQDNERYALKVFYPQYRDKRLLENTDKVHRFKDLEGFRVAKRRVLTPEAFPDLLKKFPDLTYAVLMPWIDGTVWGNLILETDPSLQPENYVQIAYALARVVSSLELQGLAHCDLSNNNFIIAKSPAGLQLIDIEDMYGPDMPRPVPDVSYGTVGYRTKWIAAQGLWGPESDRFSLAVLCSEIITWHHEEIRENKSGSTSFFDEEEIGEDCDRYNLMLSYLGNESDELPALLERAWFSTDFAHCPTVMEWRQAIRRVQLQVAPEPSPYVEDQTHIATIIMGKGITPELKPMEVAPAPEPQWVQDLDEEPPPSAVAVEKTDDAVDANLQAMPVAESEADHPPEVDDQFELEEPVQEQTDGTMPIGVPPKMNLSLEILDFGTIGRPENSRQFSISNSGGASLDVSIQAEEWIDLSLREFALATGQQQSITASINTRFPMPKTGSEYRTASALTIETNIGSEVIGAKFTLAKPAFYVSWWKRALVGMLVGSIFGCVLLLLALAGADPTTIVVIPIVLILCGLAGIIAYPGKSSVIPLILGLALIEILSLILSLVLDLHDELAVILGVGAGLGCIGGAIASRIFIPMIRRADGATFNK
jgi:serine/threonine protein kinase